MNLETRLNDWKKKLLDLGKRNSLINFKLDSKSILRFTNPSMSDLWNTIVENNGEIKFPCLLDKDKDKDEGNEAESTSQEYEYGTAMCHGTAAVNGGAQNHGTSSSSRISYQVTTNQKPKDAQRILKKLKKSYKSISEEQDVNVLYLTFGMLEWVDNDSSKQKLYSPLILVPVSLECESIKSPIILKAIEDEITINPTLGYKMNHDFNLTLPEFNEDDFSVNIGGLKKFADDNGWTFRDDVCLSILSFLKINMYKDLERHKDAIMKHTIINAFAGNFNQDELGKLTQTAESIEGFDHDSQKPQDVYQIVDADSSQQDAILCASKGVSFVLQGPPGTGKSQTITNIIASKLAEGKKVLFVSEKKAALDVVYNRLKGCGFADFILTLHSNKANKKETLNQLENVLALSRKQVSVNDSVQYKLDKLVKDRKELNDYAKQVNEVVPPLNKSIFYANGVVSEYSDVDDVSFSLPDIRNTTEEQFREYVAALEQVAGSIKAMNDDCSTNPWRNNVVQRMSNEFIHDVSEKKELIVKAADEFKELFEELAYKLEITAVRKNIDEAEKIISILKTAVLSPIVPEFWLEDKAAETLEKHIDEQAALQSDFVQLLENVKSLVQKLRQQNLTWNFESTDFYSSNAVGSLIEKLEEIISSDPCYANLYSDVNKLGFVINNEQIVSKYNEITAKVLAEYNKDIFSVDAKAMAMRYKYNYNSVFKVFKSSYRNDKKLLRQMQNNPKQKKTDAETVALLESLASRAELKESIDSQQPQMSVLFPLLYKKENTDFEPIRKELEKFDTLKNCTMQSKQLKRILEQVESRTEQLKSLFAGYFDGIKTDWNIIKANVSWLKTFVAECGGCETVTVNQNFIVKTSTEKAFITQIESLLTRLEELLRTSKEHFVWFADKFEKPDEYLALSIKYLAGRITSCAENIDDLETWIDYRSGREEVARLGLNEYLQIIENKPLKSADIVPAFEKRFFRLWLDSVYAEYPAVSKFRRNAHEDLISEFADLDKLQLDIARARIKAGIINSLPALDTFTSGEVNVLKRELSKQRKIMPIRKLFNKIPNLLLTLKPCLMMSPLSVSQFLESDCYQFDTVIFDEASQVKTENAIGAIFRGKQVIIAGDSKQLPPTNFFEVTTNDGDFDTEYDEENELLDTSILEEALFLPNKELRWHYRSRHEHLIAFSNSRIYKNKLVTFPSNTENVPDWGVEYIFVENGTYNGKGNPRGNVVEAERVAQEVFRHIKTHPERTLGVITFGVVQEFAIESAINKMRQQYPEHEAFFAEDREEAFFVKSLENVQGDERDTILFSIGYAKDSSGKMAMRFGPLSMSGGERRLNVAVTRAKYNIKLIGSILPTDIDTERVSQEGPKLLRKYIEFAMRGIEVLQNDAGSAGNVQFESPLEESICQFLLSKGYGVSMRVGCSDYKLDMAVKHPDVDGVFVLGIECDGASYYSTRTARERNRLRDYVLDMMGWKIYRIWSTDWIKDNAKEKQQLLKAVESAILSFNGNTICAKKTAPAVEEGSMLSVSEKDVPVVAGGFEEYKEYDITQNKSRYTVMDQVVLDMIKLEQPVHFDVICQRLCKLMGREKVTSVVQNSILTVLKRNDRKLLHTDDFYCLADGVSDYKVRTAGSRQIKYISGDEISKGILYVLQNNIGMTTQELVTETAKAFGFKRIGPNIEENIKYAMDYLVQNGIIYTNEDKVFVK